MSSASERLSSGGRSNEEWLELDRRFRMEHRYTSGAVLVKGAGSYVWDANGKRYLDFEAGQVCNLLGHCNPKLTAAITEQASTLLQTGSAFTDPPQILLAMKLAELMPGDLSRSYFACTGAESNEAALAIARTHTGRSEIATLTRGYHGMTHATRAVTGFGGTFRNVPGVGLAGTSFLPSPDASTCAFAGCGSECNLSCIRQAEELLDATTSGRPAAIILEVIQSAGGMVVPSREYVQEIRRICDERGALMIVDEAQTGIGRTGRWFGVEHFDVVPDIITTSKGIGGGVPLSAVTTTPEIADSVSKSGFVYSSTHTGDPLLAAAGLATIGIIEADGLVANAERRGAYLKDRLTSLMLEHEIVTDVRGIGLMVGLAIGARGELALPAPRLASIVSQYCFDQGLLLGHRPTGVSGGNVIRFIPPLTVTDSEIDEALAILADGLQLAELEGERARPLTRFQTVANPG